MSIRLYNVIYKLVSKVLANKLKRILLDIISKNKCTFILERLITDNVNVAYEVLNSMKTRQKGKMGSMVVKLDIFKTYDKLVWIFLEEMMWRLRFAEQ